MRLILLRGLPGSGKSTLARALAPRLGAVVLDKDQVRAVLFPGGTVEYSTAQDDLVITLMLEAARWHLRHRDVLLDGRVFAAEAQIKPCQAFCQATGAMFVVIECVCPLQEARRRVAADAAHPARNRTPELVSEQADKWEPFSHRQLIRIDTTRPLAECVEAALAALARYTEADEPTPLS